MLIKMIGALCIVVGCGAVGFRLTSAYKYEEKCLRQLLSVVSYMRWELEYRMAPLPTLCRQAVEHKNGAISRYFKDLAEEMEAQISPDVSQCCEVCMSKSRDLPRTVRRIIQLLGEHLGKFDLIGQVDCLDSVKVEIERELDNHCENKNNRIRCYQTLGLCVGAALAILFI